MCRSGLGQLHGLVKILSMCSSKPSPCSNLGHGSELSQDVALLTQQRGLPKSPLLKPLDVWSPIQSTSEPSTMLGDDPEGAARTFGSAHSSTSLRDEDSSLLVDGP